MISYLPNDESEIEEYRIFSDVVFVIAQICLSSSPCDW